MWTWKIHLVHYLNWQSGVCIPLLTTDDDDVDDDDGNGDADEEKEGSDAPIVPDKLLQFSEIKAKMRVCMCASVLVVTV